MLELKLIHVSKGALAMELPLKSTNAQNMHTILPQIDFFFGMRWYNSILVQKCITYFVSKPWNESSVQKNCKVCLNTFHIHTAYLILNPYKLISKQKTENHNIIFPQPRHVYYNHWIYFQCRNDTYSNVCRAYDKICIGCMMISTLLVL